MPLNTLRISNRLLEANAIQTVRLYEAQLAGWSDNRDRSGDLASHHSSVSRVGPGLTTCVENSHGAGGDFPV